MRIVTYINKLMKTEEICYSNTTQFVEFVQSYISKSHSEHSPKDIFNDLPVATQFFFF